MSECGVDCRVMKAAVGKYGGIIRGLQIYFTLCRHKQTVKSTLSSMHAG